MILIVYLIYFLNKSLSNFINKSESLYVYLVDRIDRINYHILLYDLLFVGLIKYDNLITLINFIMQFDK